MNADLCAECGLKIPTWRSKQAKFCDSKCADKHGARRRKGRIVADQGGNGRLGTSGHVPSDKPSTGPQRPAVGGVVGYTRGWPNHHRVSARGLDGG
jgi:hypothetical protein